VRHEHLHYLCCPHCRGTLKLEEEQHTANDRIEHGVLRCGGCGTSYPIVRYVPRFVPDEGYVEDFGLEWNLHRRTQYDRTSGAPLSRRRFFEETRWPRRLDGEVLIEAGSGSGRFTEHALGTGAMVLSLDYSRAVDANYESNGHHDNLLLVQGDLFRMPFRRDCADRLFCFGVLQHTPDPQAALRSLSMHTRPGGEVVADIYAKTVAKYIFGTKYWIRPLTRRMPPERLYGLTSRYVERMWPVARRLRRIPKVGKPLNWRLLIGDYGDLIEDDAMLIEWAKLDTFDMLAPRFDNPARARTARRWCHEIGLVSIDVRRGWNGFEIHARRPMS